MRGCRRMMGPLAIGLLAGALPAAHAPAPTPSPVTAARLFSVVRAALNTGVNAASKPTPGSAAGTLAAGT